MQGRKANLVIQNKPKGMGDAVLTYEKSPIYNSAKNILLIWGDVPFIRDETINSLCRSHFENNNDFTLITKKVDNAYTIVERDLNNKIVGIKETRESGSKPQKGERDIGLFLFKKDLIFNLLNKRDLEGKYGTNTNEHGFLYLIKHLSNSGYKIEGLQIANDKELKSLNSLSDLI